MSSSLGSDKLNYKELINESVHTSDDKDIGDIYAINEYFIVIKRGFINIHYYYIPFEKVEGWDGNVLWLKVSEKEVSKYERDIFPNPWKYYIKGTETKDLNPPPTVNQIPAKFKTTIQRYATNEDKEDSDIYKCDLCDTILSNKEELKSHIAEIHI